MKEILNIFSPTPTAGLWGLLIALVLTNVSHARADDWRAPTSSQKAAICASFQDSLPNCCNYPNIFVLGKGWQGEQQYIWYFKVLIPNRQCTGELVTDYYYPGGKNPDRELYSKVISKKCTN